jgi:hypothetical protein
MEAHELDFLLRAAHYTGLNCAEAKKAVQVEAERLCLASERQAKADKASIWDEVKPSAQPSVQ